MSVGALHFRTPYTNNMHGSSEDSRERLEFRSETFVEVAGSKSERVRSLGILDSIVEQHSDKFILRSLYRLACLFL